MAAAAEEKRKDDLLEEEDSFRRTAFLLINKMVELASGGVRALVDEILHSIFFLGRINDIPFSPEDILRDAQLIQDLKGKFPRPFDLCSSELPRRSPFSCMLDMRIHLTGRENETKIMDDLRALLVELDQSKYLVSSIICVSQGENDPVKYYGVSVSASGTIPRRIMIAASCLGTWDEYVAGAVMTFVPTNRSKVYDGTIQLPKSARCEAFSLRKKEVKPACTICVALFGLPPPGEKADWACGNCAEVESLSNLLKNVAHVKESAKPKSPLYTDKKREKAVSLVKESLNNLLKLKTFTWNKTFYAPQ